MRKHWVAPAGRQYRRRSAHGVQIGERRLLHRRSPLDELSQPLLGGVAIGRAAQGQIGFRRFASDFEIATGFDELRQRRIEQRSRDGAGRTPLQSIENATAHGAAGEFLAVLHGAIEEARHRVPMAIACDGEKRFE